MTKDRSPESRNPAMKTALTECEAAFKKSNEAGEHPATGEAFRAFRAGWYARSETAKPEPVAEVIDITNADFGDMRTKLIKTSPGKLLSVGTTLYAAPQETAKQISKAQEYAGHGLNAGMVKAHYPETQHQPDECQICAEVFEIAAEALAACGERNSEEKP